MILETSSTKLFLDMVLEISVVWLFDRDCWEQILNNSGKKRQVILEELRNICIFHSTDQYSVFWIIGISSLETSCHNKHRLDGSHTEIIMILLRELL